MKIILIDSASLYHAAKRRFEKMIDYDKLILFLREKYPDYIIKVFGVKRETAFVRFLRNIGCQTYFIDKGKTMSSYLITELLTNEDDTIIVSNDRCLAFALDRISDKKKLYAIDASKKLQETTDYETLDNFLTDWRPDRMPSYIASDVVECS